MPMDNSMWKEGSFFDNLDKFANSLGYQNAAIAMELAMMSWPSTYERDAFITSLTGEEVKGGTERNFIKQNY